MLNIHVDLKSQSKLCRVKFMFSKKATKLTKSSPSSVYLFDTYLVNVKLIVKILSIFVANLRKHEIYKKIFLSVINSYNNPFEIAF